MAKRAAGDIRAFFQRKVARSESDSESSSSSESGESSEQDVQVDLFGNCNRNKARVNQIRLEPGFVVTSDFINLDNPMKEAHWAKTDRSCQGFGEHRWSKVKVIYTDGEVGVDESTTVYLCDACDESDLRQEEDTNDGTSVVQFYAKT